MQMGGRLLLLLEGDILASSEAALAPESPTGKAPPQDPGGSSHSQPDVPKPNTWHCPDYVGLGIVLGGGGAVILLFAFVWCIRRSLKADDDDDEKFLDNLSGVPSRLSYEQLKQVTDGFRTRLGEGGFGSVFEGKMRGVKIAVKRLNRQIGSLDFRAEVATVGSAHHVNLVQLRGFCAQGRHRLLVYDFMPNSSLDKWIFSGGEVGDSGQGGTRILDWSQRFNIALGTAKGLAYLHNECNKRIIHSDIKPQNILLDERFDPKVSDFGLSRKVRRSFGADLQNAVGTPMQGTVGYMAPEQRQGRAVIESDVYSYGLVLFELIRGRRNQDRGEGGEYFPSTCLRKVSEPGFERSTLAELVDPQLNGSFDEEQIERVLHVAICCIQEAPSARPNMRDVVLILEGTLQLSIDLTSMQFPWGIRDQIFGTYQRQAGADNRVTGDSVESTPSTSLITSGETISAPSPSIITSGETISAVANQSVIMSNEL